MMDVLQAPTIKPVREDYPAGPRGFRVFAKTYMAWQRANDPLREYQNRNR